jgi:hypothetical protein
MKLFTLVVFSLLFIVTACKTTETRSNVPSGPTTVAQQIEKNPENAEKFSWISEDEQNNVWVYVDEFPRIINGMKELQDRISRTVRNNPSVDCDQLKGERVLYQFVINEDGDISKIRSLKDEPNSCSDLVEITIRLTQFTTGKVDGKPVSVMYTIPVNF